MWSESPAKTTFLLLWNCMLFLVIWLHIWCKPCWKIQFVGATVALAATEYRHPQNSDILPASVSSIAEKRWRVKRLMKYDKILDYPNYLPIASMYVWYIYLHEWLIFLLSCREIRQSHGWYGKKTCTWNLNFKLGSFAFLRLDISNQPLL